MDETSLKQATDRYRQVIKKAMNSRDKKLVREISKLEKEYDEKLAKLEKKADKTMNPELRKEWRQARKEYSILMDKVEIELENHIK